MSDPTYHRHQRDKDQGHATRVRPGTSRSSCVHAPEGGPSKCEESSPYVTAAGILPDLRLIDGAGGKRGPYPPGISLHGHNMLSKSAESILAFPLGSQRSPKSERRLETRVRTLRPAESRDFDCLTHRGRRLSLRQENGIGPLKLDSARVMQRCQEGPTCPRWCRRPRRKVCLRGVPPDWGLPTEVALVGESGASCLRIVVVAPNRREGGHYGDCEAAQPKSIDCHDERRSVGDGPSTQVPETGRRWMSRARAGGWIDACSRLEGRLLERRCDRSANGSAGWRAGRTAESRYVGQNPTLE